MSDLWDKSIRWKKAESVRRFEPERRNVGDLNFQLDDQLCRAIRNEMRLGAVDHNRGDKRRNS